MTAEVLSILVFAVVLVVVCWMFAEYWISVRSRGTGEDVGKLRFGSRTAFALTHFWKAVDDAGDIPKEKLRKEMSLVNQPGADRSFREVQCSTGRMADTKEVEVTRKKYKMKENM
ncbi:hypothetical protein [Claveliimonas bilis]|uniref:ATP synthase F0 subunit 8 n=1 Tax=Claveliimonas bilis TaxID=3028070 RepID=A0ABM8I1S2_9FIRM|nr:hypothetical protein [Claveliimonas bilis]MCQ5202821.1 hypothetical protein [Mordavella massiliensis]BDZ76554.1 hypothetical protein Lac1_07370 [Claveliimonas bilis]BDZ84674.1 hypothetical protein Lac2_28080 [Claveliimonas bilis]